MMTSVFLNPGPPGGEPVWCCRSGLAGWPRSERQRAPVLCAGGGQPLVEPGGFASVGVRGEELGGDLDVGQAAEAQVWPSRSGELETDRRVVGCGDLVRARQCCAAGQPTVGRKRWPGRVRYGADACGGGKLERPGAAEDGCRGDDRECDGCAKFHGDLRLAGRANGFWSSGQLAEMCG